MTTRHIDKYSAEECEAYRVVSSYKWDEAFECSRPRCGYNKYFEGGTPYSRRCVKCKRDESAKAHTIFDKLRMPLHKCLQIVKMVMESGNILIPDDLTKQFAENGISKGVDKRAVEAFLEKIYEWVFQEGTSLKGVYEKDALFILISGARNSLLLSRGVINNKVEYHLDRLNSDIGWFRLKNYTLPETKCAAMSLEYNTWNPVVTKHEIEYRPALSIDIRDAIGLANEFYHCRNNPVVHCYKKER